jgi:hypothetical protein
MRFEDKSNLAYDPESTSEIQEFFKLQLKLYCLFLPLLRRKSTQRKGVNPTIVDVGLNSLVEKFVLLEHRQPLKFSGDDGGLKMIATTCQVVDFDLGRGKSSEYQCANVVRVHSAFKEPTPYFGSQLAVSGQ